MLALLPSDLTNVASILHLYDKISPLEFTLFYISILVELSVSSWVIYLLVYLAVMIFFQVLLISSLSLSSLVIFTFNVLID